MYAEGAARLRRQVFGAAVFPAIIILTISSCVTRQVPISRDYSALLFKEGGIFLQLKPQRDYQLTSEMLQAVGMDPESLKKILDRTENIYANYFWSEDGLMYTILGAGRYPDTAAALSLRGSRDWERVKRDYAWWQYLEAPLQLSFVTDDLICISNGGIEEALQRIYRGPEQRIPEEVRLQMNAAAMGLYAVQPDIPVENIRLFSELESFWLTFEPSEEEEEERHVFRVNGKYSCTSPEVARSLYLTMRLNLVSSMIKTEGAGRIKSMNGIDPVLLDGRSIILEEYPLSLERIRWFFGTVLPYVEPIVNSGQVNGGQSGKEYEVARVGIV
ncbi:MAG: hypothetical protein ACP5IA_09550, partial [Sediminispirochaetaceae bacterium]